MADALLSPTDRPLDFAVDLAGHVWKLPSAMVLENMPSGLREEVHKMARSRLTTLFLPRVRAWLAFNSKRAQIAQMNPGQVQSVMRHHPVFVAWPESSLRSLATQAMSFSVKPGEVIQGNNLIVCVWSGTVVCGDKTKSVGPTLLGAEFIISDEPSQVSYTAETGVHGATISKRLYTQEVSALPPELQDVVLEKPLAQRGDVLRSYFPLSLSKLRQCCLFSDLDDAQLERLQQRLIPFSCRAGTQLLLPSSTTQEMVFLRRGEAQVVGDNVKVPLRPGASFGEMRLVFGERSPYYILATAFCDFWILTSSSLRSAMESDVTLAVKVQESAHRQRMKFLQSQGKEVAGLSATLLSQLRSAPVLRSIEASDEVFREMCKLLRPKVFVPGQQIVSAVDACDHVLVVSRGKVLVRQDIVRETVMLHPGDIVGYTCLAEHRWLFPLVAHTTCDLWVLHRDDLIHTLKKFGLLSRARREVRGLIDMPAGVLRITRTDDFPPLLHPTRGLPGLGYLASYVAREKQSTLWTSKDTASPRKPDSVDNMPQVHQSASTAKFFTPSPPRSISNSPEGISAPSPPRQPRTASFRKEQLRKIAAGGSWLLSSGKLVALPAQPLEAAGKYVPASPHSPTHPRERRCHRRGKRNTQPLPLIAAPPPPEASESDSATTQRLVSVALKLQTLPYLHKEI
eukprot:Sspe_Gene.85777::Locus_56538_Transcript_1_2_Confidence_0.667_Length_2185::g.85777::m.85777